MPTRTSLGSTPPSRASTPVPVRAPGKRGHIVSFVRPLAPAGSSWGAEREALEAVNLVGTSAEDLTRSQTLPPVRRWSGTPGSAGAELSSHGPSGSLLGRGKQGDRRRFSADTWSTRVEGFAAQSNVPLPELKPSPISSPERGLLSRQLSSNCLETVPSGEALNNSSLLKEKLQKCFEAQPARREVDPALLLKSLQTMYPVFKMPMVVRAFKVAAMAHGTQRGLDDEAILVQCGETARYLASLGADPATVAAGLLSEVLDGSMMVEAHLRQLVPVDVASIVVKVAKMSGLCAIRRGQEAVGGAARPEVEPKFIAMLLAMADVRTVLVKLAERLQHLKAAARGPERAGPAALAAAREAIDLFAPLANRLGVWAVKAELEDLAFQVLHPVEHRELAAACATGQARGALEAVLDELKAAMAAGGLAGDLSGRPKNLWGAFTKMRTKGYGLEQVYDLRALRVIAASKAECYEVLRMVHTLWEPVEGRLKDYIRKPKDNGYQSLHTVVRGPGGGAMEVQIRTSKMHFCAEYGVAAHWRYKEALQPDALQEQLVGWGRWLIEWSLELNDAKVRPRGSPPQRDSALARLARGICTFPTHGPDCKFARYLHTSRLAPQPPAEGSEAAAPVMVVVFDRTDGASPAASCLRIETLPAGCNAGTLANYLRAGHNAPGPLRVLVNHEEADATLRLAHGDAVELFSSASEYPPPPLPPPPALPTPCLDAQRARLQRIFGASGELDDACPAGCAPVAC